MVLAKFLGILLLVLVVSTISEGKKEKMKKALAVIHENPAKQGKANKNHLANILADMKTLDSHDIAKLHRILMHGKVLRKLNKALKKEANDLVRLSSSDANAMAKEKQSDLHQLKRLMLLKEKSPVVRLTKQFRKGATMKDIPALNKKLHADIREQVQGEKTSTA